MINNCVALIITLMFMNWVASAQKASLPIHLKPSGGASPPTEFRIDSLTPAIQKIQDDLKTHKFFVWLTVSYMNLNSNLQNYVLLVGKRGQNDQEITFDDLYSLHTDGEKEPLEALAKIFKKHVLAIKDKLKKEAKPLLEPSRSKMINPKMLDDDELWLKNSVIYFNYCFGKLLKEKLISLLPANEKAKPKADTVIGYFVQLIDAELKHIAINSVHLDLFVEIVPYFNYISNINNTYLGLKIDEILKECGAININSFFWGHEYIGITDDIVPVDNAPVSAQQSDVVMSGIEPEVPSNIKMNEDYEYDSSVASLNLMDMHNEKNLYLLEWFAYSLSGYLFNLPNVFKDMQKFVTYQEVFSFYNEHDVEAKVAMGGVVEESARPFVLNFASAAKSALESRDGSGSYSLNNTEDNRITKFDKIAVLGWYVVVMDNYYKMLVGLKKTATPLQSTGVDEKTRRYNEDIADQADKLIEYVHVMLNFANNLRKRFKGSLFPIYTNLNDTINMNLLRRSANLNQLWAKAQKKDDKGNYLVNYYIEMPPLLK